MGIGKFPSVLALAAMLSACGGGGGTGASNVTLPINSGGGATPAPTGGGSTCSLVSRQNWVKAQLDEWYLFPETLPATLSPAPFATVQEYVDALTATARSQNRDRFFTFITSIAEENAFLASGATAGFGIRLSYDSAASRVFVIEAFEGAPALAAGIDRGSEITGIGTIAANIQSVTSLFASGGAQAVSSALGPSTAGTSRVLRIRDAGGNETTVTVTKATFDIQPISPRYGVQIIDNGGTKTGYINLRTFIDSAEPQLRNAFEQFRAAGVTELVIDLRYNGGGLVRTAELFADLLGGARVTSDVQGVTRYRASKSSNNVTRNFRPQSQSISPTKVAFITTGSSASASELVINAMIPSLDANMALVGTNTFGKPVGQIGLDQAACDDRLRVVAFTTENSAGNANYFSGLASSLTNSCNAADDFTLALGNPAEASTARALGYLSGASCTPITSSQPGAVAGQNAAQRGKFAAVEERRELLMPQQPTPAQREVPGTF
ncbi:S41 family peptidase [Parasphingorhabdus halotolerans]|uniref:Peptidase S41 n=1 Tax=Parasphingorhabdus halotolerans TaxID=2725558 RepID=A0A6H2DL21_9SPHN|nr:S41 family peptidase [Parasphingorhabdus halotolerans]QJB68683.1 peptidase S41 [Parasphingorhabdus halotolerans]